MAIVATPQTFIAPTPSFMPVPVPTMSMTVPGPVPTMSYIPPGAMPAPPVPIPAPQDPRQASEQFGKTLEAKLAQQSAGVTQEAQIRKQMLEEQAKRDLAQFQLQVDEELKMACMAVDKDALIIINGLQEAAITRKTAMEEEAAVKTAGYNKAKAMETMAMQSYQVQKQFHEAEKKLKADYDQVMRAGVGSILGAGLMPPAYAMPPPVVPGYAPMMPGYTAPVPAVPGHTTPVHPAQVHPGPAPAPAHHSHAPPAHHSHAPPRKGAV